MKTKDNKKSAWDKAQEKEYESWFETDMTYDYLMNNWLNRKDDFNYLISRVKSDSSVLDIGSGPVSVLHVFPKCKKMIALDPLNEQYKKRYKRLPHINYLSTKAEDLEFADQSFDFITCVNALDHMDNYQRSLREMIRCLRKDGIIFLEYENTTPISYFLHKIGYKKPLADFHPILVRNPRVKKVLKENNCQIIKIKCRPQFSFRKVKSVLAIFLAKKQVSSYERKISALNYGLGKTLIHYMIIFSERIFYPFAPTAFGYFTIVYAKKKG